MAEAHRAVRPLPSIQLGTGVDARSPFLQIATSAIGVSIFIPYPRFLLRTAVRSAKRLHVKVSNSFFPVPAPVAFGGLLAGLLLLGNSSPATASIFDARVSSRIPLLCRLKSLKWRNGLVLTALSHACMLAVTAVHRTCTKMLLAYSGWLTESHGKVSKLTKLWALSLRFFIGKRKKNLLNFQQSLPSLPLASLEVTTASFVGTQKPLLPSLQFKQLQSDRDTFLQNEGPKLQRYLKLKYWTSANYVNEWWLRFVYLTSRDPLLIDSNYYIGSFIDAPPTSRPASRGAFLISTLLNIKRMIDSEKLPPTTIRNLVPMCMSQYLAVFSMTREALPKEDHLEQYPEYESRHIAVIANGCYFKLDCWNAETGRWLSAVELELALDGILLDVESPMKQAAEADLWALTAADRSRWAEVRQDFFLGNYVNRVSLGVIESALFVLSFDATTPKSGNLSDQGNQWFHGFGVNPRWCDKSFTLCIAPDGNCGINCEHSWGDAPTMSHVWEICLAREIAQQPYNAEGRINGPRAQLPQPGERPSGQAERLPFQIAPALKNHIGDALRSVKSAIADIDLVVHHFTRFGRETIKKTAKCPPDGFIQMSFQLAYFNVHGKFVDTYESAMLRLYREGRTETIRSVTQESCDWVRAMAGKTLPREELRKSLQNACERHRSNGVRAMIGKGVDRHLFALYVVAHGLGIASPFLEHWKSCQWKLSTSQVPIGQAKEEWPTPDFSTVHAVSGGGFGPVAEDGYGISYNTGPEDTLFFHISSSRSTTGKDTTTSEELYQAVEHALTDMMALSFP